MQNSVKGKKTSLDAETLGSDQVTGSRCPECGGKMVASARQVMASFPAPPLERRVCEESSCNYSKFVRADGGMTGMNGSSGRKGLK